MATQPTGTGTGAPTRGERAALVVAIVVTAIHLTGHVLIVGGVRGPGQWTTDLTQILAMAALAGWLWWSARPAPAGAAQARLLRWTLIALGFSWVGDTLPRFLSGDTAFLAMVGGFLLAQIAYVVAFGPLFVRAMRSTSPIRGVKSPPTLVGIGLVYLMIVVFLAMLLLPHTGALSVPVVGYGVCLGAMGVAAWALGPVAGIGGAIFFASDALIAIGRFLPALFETWPYGLRGLVVMVTYLAGQWLLITAVRKAVGLPTLSAAA